MFTRILTVLLSAALAAACAPAALATSTPSPAPAATRAGDPPPAEYPAAVLAATAYLSQQTGIAAGEIQVLSIEAVDWPDACLGVARKGVMCAQVITPGYKVLLAAAGREYELHTDSAGAAVVQK